VPFWQKPRRRFARVETTRPGQRLVAKQATKIAVQNVGMRHVHESAAVGPIAARPFHVEKEEELRVAERREAAQRDGAADVPAELIQSEWRFFGCQRIARVERLVSQELIAGAVELFAAAPGGRRNQGRPIAPELGVEDRGFGP